MVGVGGGVGACTHYNWEIKAHPGIKAPIKMNQFLLSHAKNKFKEKYLTSVKIVGKRRRKSITELNRTIISSTTPALIGSSFVLVYRNVADYVKICSFFVSAQKSVTRDL